MYLQCDGVDYTMLFDAKSFILDKQFDIKGSDNKKTGFALQKRIERNEIDPRLVQYVMAIEDSISVISLNNTSDAVGQTLVTYYQDAD